MPSRTLAAAAMRLNRGRRRQGLPRLWLLTDASRLPDPAPLLPALGRLPLPTAVLLRYYRPDAAEIRRIRDLARRHGVAVILAGSLRQARRLGLDGAHYPEAQARAAAGRLAHRGLWLTAAAHGPAAMRRAARIGADAVLLAPVFATASHPGAPALGLRRFAALARRSQVPVVALGGIEAGNAGRAIAAGAAGLAAIGALARELSRRPCGR
jgi:thiamine-phosphate pyrophosphorylase